MHCIKQTILSVASVLILFVQSVHECDDVRSAMLNQWRTL